MLLTVVTLVNLGESTLAISNFEGDGEPEIANRQIESTYISGTMTDSVEITTNTTSSKKCIHVIATTTTQNGKIGAFPVVDLNRPITAFSSSE